MNSPFKRFTHVNECKVMQVIEVRSIVGEGTNDDPVSVVVEYYSFDGERLARKTQDDKLTDGHWLSDKTTKEATDAKN